MTFILANTGIDSGSPGIFGILTGHLCNGLFTSGNCVSRGLFSFLFRRKVRLIAKLHMGVGGGLVPFCSEVVLHGECVVRAVGSVLGGATRVMRSHRESMDGFVVGLVSTLKTCYFFSGGPGTLRKCYVRSAGRLALFWKRGGLFQFFVCDSYLVT